MKLTVMDADTVMKRFLADAEAHRRSSNKEVCQEAISTNLPNDQSSSVLGTSNLSSKSVAVAVDPQTEVYHPQVTDLTPFGYDASSASSISKKPEPLDQFTKPTQSDSRLQELIRQTIRDTIREELRVGPSGVSKVYTKSSN